MNDNEHQLASQSIAKVKWLVPNSPLDQALRFLAREISRKMLAEAGEHKDTPNNAGHRHRNISGH